MGRASTRTMLALDRWAQLLGLEPRHFNGITTLLAPQRSCHEPWGQYAWQAADRVSREDVADAISQAESDVVEALGFYPVPQWTDGEVVRTTQPNDRMLVGGPDLLNQRGLFLSVHAAMGQFITGGVKAAPALIGVAVRTAVPAPGDTWLWVDVDGDGYFEIGRITLPTTVTDVNEVRCYFPGHGQEDEWEIRPLRAVTIAGGNVTIDIDRHLLVDPDLWEAIDLQTVDGDDNADFILTIDVYQVANDPSQQAQLQWERVPGDCGCGSSTCASCAWATQWACLQGRDPRLGILTYQPAIWDTDTDEYALACLALDRAPERVRLYYLSGFESAHVKRPMVEMDRLLERIITLYSVTLLDRPLCSCENVNTYVARWQEDLALMGDSSYRVSNTDLDCPWGTRSGAIWAWRQVKRLAIGRAVAY